MLFADDVELPVAGPGLNRERERDEWKDFQLLPAGEVVAIENVEISIASTYAVVPAVSGKLWVIELIIGDRLPLFFKGDLKILSSRTE